MHQSEQILIKTPNKPAIRIYNDGSSPARNIRYEVSPENSFYIMNTNNFPFELLNAQESTDLFIQYRSAASPKIRLLLWWDDDSSTDNKYEQFIALW